MNRTSPMPRLDTKDVFPYCGRIGLALLLQDLLRAALRRRRT